MKRKTLLLSFLLMIFWGASSVQAQQANSVTQPTGDTWVRSDQTNTNYGSGNTVEMRNSTNKFYGVMQFSFDAPQVGYRVSSATLRLTTRYKKGDSKLNVYALDAEVTDASTYATLSSAITSAIENSPLTSFNVKGYSAWAPTDGAVTDDWNTVDKWQNNIDLTDYVKSLGTNSFALLFQKDYVQDYSTQIYSKEATDETNTSKGFTFEAVDLVPQLTVTYEVDPDVSVSTVGTAADTWLRMNNNDNHASNVSLEISSTKSEDVFTKDFVGVMKFNLPSKPGYTIESASLRLVTDTRKGSTTMTIYPFADFNESDKYAAHADDVSAARAAGAITTFTVNGLYNKQLSASDAITSEYTSVESWTNTVDITSYVQGLNSNMLSIMLENMHNSPNKIFTKEAGTYTKTVDAVEYTFKSEDLVPQLTIVYRKMASYELTVGSYGAATLSLPFDATIPDGVTCYTLNYTSGDKVTATEVTGGTLSANTPVLVNATTGNYEFTRTGEIVSASAVSGALTGVYATTDVPTESYILWANAENPIGFYKANNSTVAAYRAYLTAEGAGVKALSIIFGDETGIKAMDNGQWTMDNGRIYNLAGQRLSKARKGINIVNGKKYVVK